MNVVQNTEKKLELLSEFRQGYAASQNMPLEQLEQEIETKLKNGTTVALKSQDFIYTSNEVVIGKNENAVTERVSQLISRNDGEAKVIIVEHNGVAIDSPRL